MFEKFTAKARLAVAAAQQEARELGHDHIGPEHILLGLLTPPDSVAAGVLTSAGLSRPTLVDAVKRNVPVLGMLSRADADALQVFDIDAEAVLAAAREHNHPPQLRARRRRLSRSAGHLTFTPQSKKALEGAIREATRLGHNYIGTEHLLLGLLRQQTSPAMEILTELKIEPTALGTATELAIPKVA